jgi:MFS family permease
MSKHDLRSQVSFMRQRAWWPAVPLVLVQLALGMWYLPQLSFFAIYLKEQLGLAPEVIGSLVAGGQVAGMLAALLGGALTDRIGTKNTLVLGLAGTALGTLVFQTHTPWLAALLWAVSGAALALQTLSGASYLTRLTARGSLGVLSAIYTLAMTVGGTLGNPAAGVVLDRWGFRAYGFSGTTLMTLATFFAILAIARLSGRAAAGLGRAAFWHGALAVIRQPNMLMVMGLRCLPTICYSIVGLLVPLLINNATGSKTVVAAYATATLIVASAAQMLAGRAGDRFGARRPTLAGYGLLAVGALGLAATNGSLWGLFLFGVIAIAAAWALSALMYLWVSDGIPQAEHGWAFGLLHSVWSLSMVIGSLLGGWLMRPVAGLPFLLGGLLNVGSLFLIVAYYARLPLLAPAPALGPTPKSEQP